MNSQLITKQSISVPSAISVSCQNSVLLLKGPLGQVKVNLQKHDKLGDCFFFVQTTQKNETVLTFSITKKRGKVFLNAFKSLISQYFVGLTQGFLVTLECVGIGYRITLENKTLRFKVGLSHVLDFCVPEDVQVFLPKQNVLCFFGVDKKRLNKIAAEVQFLKFPDSYKGKGLRLKHVKYSLKEGKQK